MLPYINSSALTLRLGSKMEDKSYIQTIKTSLKSIIKNTANIEKLQDAAIRSNRIMIHSLQFLKLYFIYLFDHGHPLPKIEAKFVNSIMKGKHHIT